ncbi:MAG TPA: pyridoxamine 5'-phosphate oxidase [Chthoniobacteraceae bacterium]|nr:pyridoxamine 5'-phosphate oxidase [Chthoniobacteraceae bacterium]
MDSESSAPTPPTDLHALRHEYITAGLSKSDLAPDPFAQFSKWMEQAITAQIPDPNAMTLATIAPDGGPAQRVVLLKTFDPKGFVFFTNYDSAKAKQIAANPRVSAHFFWEPLARQVAIRGAVEKVSTAESLAYFIRRPRGSQLGAWISPQSQVISSRKILETKLAEAIEKFKGGEIPLPSFWGGYRIAAESFEFWQGGKDRLHDRFFYSLKNGMWEISRLAP